MGWIKERIDAEFRKHYPSMFRKKYRPNLDWSLIAEKKILAQLKENESECPSIKEIEDCCDDKGLCSHCKKDTAQDTKVKSDLDAISDRIISFSHKGTCDVCKEESGCCTMECEGCYFTGWEKLDKQLHEINSPLPKVKPVKGKDARRSVKPNGEKALVTSERDSGLVDHNLEHSGDSFQDNSENHSHQYKENKSVSFPAKQNKGLGLTDTAPLSDSGADDTSQDNPETFDDGITHVAPPGKFQAQDDSECNVVIGKFNGEDVTCGNSLMGKKRYCNHCRVQDKEGINDMCVCGDVRQWHDHNKECRVDIADDPEINCDCKKFVLKDKEALTEISKNTPNSLTKISDVKQDVSAPKLKRRGVVLKKGVVDYILNGDSEKNPAHYCMGHECAVYLGHRGFCSDKCHNEHYDPIPDKSEVEVGDNTPCPKCGDNMIWDYSGELEASLWKCEGCDREFDKDFIDLTDEPDKSESNSLKQHEGAEGGKISKRYASPSNNPKEGCGDDMTQNRAVATEPIFCGDGGYCDKCQDHLKSVTEPKSI